MAKPAKTGDGVARIDDKRICVVGLGGAGCRILDRLAGFSRQGPTLAAVSTDTRTLSASVVPSKVQIGMQHVKGRGTGGDSTLGRRCAEDDGEVIASLFEGMELVLVIAGLGGGTGSGAAPVVADLARSSGAMTIGVVSLPFGFEGPQRAETARRGLQELAASSDVVLAVPADRLAKSLNKNRVEEAFLKSDEVLATAVRGLWRPLTEPGYLNLDAGDLADTLSETSGVGTLGYGEGKGKNRVSNALEAVLEGSLLERGRRLEECSAMLVSITAGPDLLLTDVAEVMDGLAGKTPDGCRDRLGIVIDETWRNRLALVVVVSEKLVEGVAKNKPEPSEVETESSSGSQRRKRMGNKTRQKTTRHLQADFWLEPPGRGRFKNVEPTIMDGEDLDSPTFIRRGITIEKE